MTQLDRYVRMIRKRAHEYSDRYGVEYEDVEAQGYLIYCECLDSFDITKSSFSTHLYTELGKLDHYCYSVSKHGRHRHVELDENGDDRSLDTVAYTASPTIEDIEECAEGVLSESAHRVLGWMLEREWERDGRRKPTISDACSFFQMSYGRMRRLWDEIGEFYRNELASVMC